MSVHEEFADDLALLALGALQGEPRVSLEAHLRHCPVCARELEKLRGDTALLGLSVAGSNPPLRSRQRLLDAVAQEKRRPEVVEPRRWWVFSPWAVAVVLAIAIATLWQQNNDLRQRFSSLESQLDEQKMELERARDIVSTLTATDALRVTLVAAKTPPQPQGKAIYVRSRGGLIFLANNMTQLPANKAYELWVIPNSGGPIPAGTFKPDTRGNASIVYPPLPLGVPAKAFAITVEPESGSAAPTSQPILLGATE